MLMKMLRLLFTTRCVCLLVSLLPVVTEAVPASVAQGSQVLAVKRNQTIGVVTITPTTLTIGLIAKAEATATSELPVSFSSSTPAICATSGMNGSFVSAIATGTCTVVANQAGNANYNAAPQKTNNVTIGKVDQAIGTITFEPITLNVAGTSIVVANSTANLPVSFSSTTPAICTIGGPDGDTVTGVSVGNCIVAATQPGNNTYSAAPRKTKTISITKLPQTVGTISFSPTTLAVGRPNIVSATATSGLPVTFTSGTPNICAVNGGTVTNISVGACMIIAIQSGNTQ
ncbi:exported hypothetical protein [Gammaproteobacteria bacterium]